MGGSYSTSGNRRPRPPQTTTVQIGGQNPDPPGVQGDRPPSYMVPTIHYQQQQQQQYPQGIGGYGGGYAQPQTTQQAGMTSYPQQPQPQPSSQPQPPPQPAQKKKTKTIRNDVNLKKRTLKIVQDEDDPTLLYPTFRFDCGAPCYVSIFYLATEHTGDKLKLKTRLQSPGKRVRYEKKLGCVFPPEDMPKSEYHAYGLVPTLYSDGELTTTELKDQVRSWPVCIRLECVVPDMEEDHDLEGLPVGCGMEDWIQSQTTYTCLTKTSEGSGYRVKVHKQKIWVQGVAYELQEIYGLENANNSEGANNGGDDVSRECVICMSEPRDTTLLPCRHMCLCHGCASLLRQQTNKCPICRTQVKSLLEITLKT